MPSPVRAEHGREQPALLIGRFQHDGAGAVAEEDAGGAVGVVDEAGEGVDADHQHALVEPGLDELAAGDEGVDETGAGRAEIERAGVAAESPPGPGRPGRRGTDPACRWRR